MDEEMASLPAGTVTFLFSDVEGSTRLTETLGERYGAVLERHRAAIRAAIEEAGGREVGTEGDSFFVVFTSAPAAVRAAARAQLALAAEAWPEGAEVRVRMGLHTGEGAVVGGDYVGLDVNRAARIAGVGHGGQIVLSKATAGLVENDLPAGAGLRDLGEHRLKDLSRPEHLYELDVPQLPHDFPPLRSLDARPNNLPVQLTSFVGRQRELAETSELLTESRLLTFTGPGGAGKSRLALQLAARLSESFPNGVFFVPLASISDPDLVPAAIARTLGIPDTRGDPRSALDRLLEHLRDREVLLVLDNFEQVVEAGPVITALLEASPATKVVVTSRAVLHLYGEHEYPVPPLGLPDPREAADPASLSQYEAVRLFIERAEAVRPGFEVTNQNAPAIAEICARLDGLPLAIELAAARVRLLPPEAILDRLGDRLSLLVGGPRDRPTRHQALRQTIAWSHDLLGPAERRLFARLGVFVGGCRLEQAEAVCGPPEELGVDVLTGISTLTDNSLLVVPDGDASEPRVVMLETIREFARERLAEQGEEGELRRRHATVFLALAEAAEPELYGGTRGRWLDRLEQEHNNFRAALEWALEEDTETALRIASALWRLWQMRGYLREGRRIVEKALALPDAGQHPEARLRVLGAAGGLAHWQADVEGQFRWYQEALDLARRLGEEQALAEALYDYAFPFVARFVQEPTEERPHPDLDQARRLLTEALELWEARGDRHGFARARWFLGYLRALDGDLEGAKQDLRESLETFQDVDDRFYMAWAQYGLGMTADAGGDYPATRSALSEALRLFAEAGDHAGVLFQLELLAKVEATHGEPERAARLAGAAAALRASTGTKLASGFPDGVTLPEGLLEEETTAAAWTEGQGLRLEEAVSYALGDVPAPVPR